MSGVRPGAPAPAELLHLQRAAGNRAVTRLATKAMRATKADGADEAWVREISNSPGAVGSSLNALLDLVPRMRLGFTAGGISVAQPAFRVCVWLAALGAGTAGWLLAPYAGLSAGAFLTGFAVTLALLVTVLLVHRLISYGFQLVALAGFLLYAVLSGGAVLAFMDVAVVAVGAAQAIGRLGCAMAGCCHGRPSRWGLRYGTAHLRRSFPLRLVGVRLAPVQLLEAALAAALVLACVALVVVGRMPGVALTTWLVGYGAGRFMLERLRGDAARPWRRGLSQAQWISLCLLAVVAALGALGSLPLFALHWVTIAGVGGIAAWRIRRFHGERSLMDRLAELAGWDELSRGLHALATAGPSEPDAPVSEGPGRRLGTRRPAHPPVFETADGLRLSLAATPAPGGPVVTYGISCRERPLDLRELERLAGLILRLRHPDRVARLLGRDPSVSYLIVEPRNGAVRDSPVGNGSEPGCMEGRS